MATTIVTKDSLIAAIKRLWSRVLHLDGNRRADIRELKESIEQTKTDISMQATASAKAALKIANAAKTAADAAQSSADSKLSTIAVNIYNTEDEYADGTSADTLNLQDSTTIQADAVTIGSDTEAKHGISLSVKLMDNGGLEETDTGVAVKVDEHYGLAINSNGNLVVRTDGLTISNSDGLSVNFADEGVAPGIDQPVSSTQVYEAIQKVKTTFVAATGSHTVPSGTNEAIAVIASNTTITLPGTGTNGQLVYIVALASATNSTLLVSNTSAGATPTRLVNGASINEALTLTRNIIYTCLYMSGAWYISYHTS